MQTYRVFKTVNYWVDVEVEDDQTEDEAMDVAMDIDQCNWTAKSLTKVSFCLMEKKMAHKTIYTEVEVDVDLSEFDTADLVEELETRGVATGHGDSKDLIEQIWLKRRLGKDFTEEIDKLLYTALGRAI